MFKRIDHIELVTAHPERAVRVYTGVLGFKVRSRDRVPASPIGPLDFVYLDLGGTTLELISYPEGVPAAAPGADVDFVVASGALWTAAFLVFTVAYYPIISRPRLDGQPG